jgi:hypothetical protein
MNIDVFATTALPARDSMEHLQEIPQHATCWVSKKPVPATGRQAKMVANKGQRPAKSIVVITGIHARASAEGVQITD